MDDLKSQQTDAGAGFAAGVAAANATRTPYIEHVAMTGQVFAWKPRGDGWEREDLTEELLLPRAIDKTVVLRSAIAFVDYVKLFAIATESIVFAKPPRIGPQEPPHEQQARFKAHLDYHVLANGRQTPARLTHKAVLTLQNTPAWLEWTKSNGVPMDQVSFARFLEDRIPHIAEPAASDLIEMSRNFEAMTSVAFKTVDRARDGARVLRYEETISEVPKAGAMPLPETITLMLAPFVDSQPRPIKARIRYTIGGGVLKLRYELVRPEDVLAEAYGDVHDSIVESLTGVVRGVFDADVDA